MSNTKQELFRMMQMRPVQEKSDDFRYIFVTENKNTELNAKLQKVKTNFENVKRISKEFLASEKFLNSYRSDRLNEITRIIENNRQHPDYNQMRGRLYELTNNDYHGFIRENLAQDEVDAMWDSLTAATMSQQKPAEREQLIQNLRTQNFLQALAKNPDSLHNDHEVKRLLEARPTLASMSEMKFQARSFAKQKPTRTARENLDFSRKIQLLNRSKDLEATKKDLKRVEKLHIQEIKKNYTQLNTSKEVLKDIQINNNTDKATLAVKSLELNPRFNVTKMTARDFNSVKLDNNNDSALLTKNPEILNALEEENDLYIISTNKQKASILSKNIQKKLMAKSQNVIKELDTGLDEELEVEQASEEIEEKITQVNRFMMQDLPTKSIVKLTRLQETMQAQAGRYNYDQEITAVFRPKADFSRYNPNKITGAFKVLGIGDLLKVEQELIDYNAGEVSHVENVLQSQSKTRSFRRKSSQEDTIFVSETEEQSSAYDLQSTKRNSMHSEVQSQLQRETNAKLGISVSASYGPVKLSTDANFSSRTAKEQASKIATDFAKEVTEKSATSVSTKVQEERTSTTRTEVEELTSHNFDNTNSNEHVVGIYQWLDKRYKNRMVNYGKRMMLEFMVPEPAAFYKFAKNNPIEEEMDVSDLPTKPDPIGSLSALDITRYNYMVLAARYNVSGIKAPPAATQVIGGIITKDYTKDQQRSTQVSKEIVIPEGYKAKSAEIDYSAAWSSKSDWSLYLLIGDKKYRKDSADYVRLNGEVGTLALGLMSNLKAVVMSIEVECELLKETYQEWQLDTYEKIRAGYERMKQAYDDAMSQGEIEVGVQISGNNPGQNRIIEQTELKKSCIRILSRDSFEHFNAMRDNVSYGYPEFDLKEAEEEGKFVQFMEQAFEWDQITYLMYPYFWGRKNNWLEIQATNDNDPVFEAFLRAGYAKVNVPVRPGYEDAINYFIHTGGEIWQGGEAPVIDDPLYVSIAEELAEPEGEQVGETWETKVATSLVMINKESQLPSWSEA
jgi:hypothetical protein